MLTPNLSGTILQGITRDSIITLLKEKGYKVEERPVSMEEIYAAYKNKELIEVFGAGTAAVVANVNRIGYKNNELLFDASQWGLSTMLKNEINGIRKGRIADTHGWILPITIEQEVAV